MIDLANSVTQSVISTFLETSLKAIVEKLRQGKKLTDVEALTLLVNERFNSVERETTSGFKAMEYRFASVDSELKAIRDRLGAIETRVSTVDDIAQLRAKVAQLEARG